MYSPLAPRTSLLRPTERQMIALSAEMSMVPVGAGALVTMLTPPLTTRVCTPSTIGSGWIENPGPPSRGRIRVIRCV